MIISIVKILPILLFAQLLVLCGVFFTSGHIFNGYLAGFYSKTSEFSRLCIALFTFFAVGNFIMSKAYLWFDASLVTPINIFSSIIMTILMTVLVFQIKPSLLLIPATLVVAVGCIWVSYLLSLKA